MRFFLVQLLQLKLLLHDVEEDETPFVPDFKSEPNPTLAAVDDNEDDAMSYFEKLANE